MLKLQMLTVQFKKKRTKKYYTMNGMEMWQAYFHCTDTSTFLSEKRSEYCYYCKKASVVVSPVSCYLRFRSIFIYSSENVGPQTQCKKTSFIKYRDLNYSYGTVNWVWEDFLYLTGFIVKLRRWFNIRLQVACKKKLKMITTLSSS